MSLTRFFLLMLFTVTLFSCSAPPGQGEYPGYRRFYKTDNFYFDPLVFYSPDSTNARIDLYIEIPAERILFKKNNRNGKYESSYSVYVTVSNQGNEKKINEAYTYNPSFTEDEMQIVSKQSRFYLYNYYLAPGDYKIEIKIKDNISVSEYSGITNLTVKNLLSSGITYSSLMLLSKYKVSGNGIKEITPLISKNVFGMKEFYVFFEIYSRDSGTVAKEYVYKIKDENDYTVKEGLFAYSVNPGVNQKTETISVLKELKKYFPEESDFEFFPSEKAPPPEKFKIEITDKSGNNIVAVKEFLFRSVKPNPEMFNRQHTH
jgi:hypothetical protein